MNGPQQHIIHKKSIIKKRKEKEKLMCMYRSKLTNQRWTVGL